MIFRTESLSLRPTLCLLAQLAEIANDASIPRLRQLTPQQRVHVMAALIIILTVGGFLLLCVRAGAKLTRWYINQPRRMNQPQGDPIRAAHGPDKDACDRRGPQSSSTQPQS